MRYPVARWWYELPPLDALPCGPALSPPLLAEECEHGLTIDVAWAYADALPAFLGRAAMADVLPLACDRGALRAAALTAPVELDGLVHVQTDSPEVCRRLGASVPSFAVRGERCVRALLDHGDAVRAVVADCAPFEVKAPFPLAFRLASRWFRSPVAECFVPLVRLDPDVWLCWDRDRSRSCVVKGHDEVFDGRWGPRDVTPEATPPPWAAFEAHPVDGARWASTVLRDDRYGGASAVADRARGWCRLHVESQPAYHDALRDAWRAGRPLPEVESTDTATFASLRLDGSTADYAWVGCERVLRLRAGALEQLTTDHDFPYEVARGTPGYTADQLAQLGDVSITTRSLPASPPEAGRCDVAEGDRFLLLDDRTHAALEHAAGGAEAFARRVGRGSARELARWARWVLLGDDIYAPVVVVDSGATVTFALMAAPAGEARSVRTRDLLERPAAFHGRHVRFRAVYRSAPEMRVIAGAWFEGTCTLGWGTWIVEADGTWLHDDQSRGHLGGYETALRGTLTPVDLSHPRAIESARVRLARPYVPLSSELVIERGIGHWYHMGKEVMRLGRDARLPVSGLPERCRVAATFCVTATGHLAVQDWNILATEPLAPVPVTADAMGPVGRHVELEGLLVPTDRYPRLDGTVDVLPPSRTRSDDPYAGPDVDDVATYRVILGSGLRVRISGEVGGPAFLRAFAVTVEDRPLAL